MNQWLSLSMLSIALLSMITCKERNPVDLQSGTDKGILGTWHRTDTNIIVDPDTLGMDPFNTNLDQTMYIYGADDATSGTMAADVTNTSTESNCVIDTQASSGTWSISGNRIIIDARVGTTCPQNCGILDAACNDDISDSTGQNDGYISQFDRDTDYILNGNSLTIDPNGTIPEYFTRVTQ